MNNATAATASLSVKDSSASFTILPTTTGLTIDGKTLKIATTYVPTTTEITVTASTTKETVKFKITAAEPIASGTVNTAFAGQTTGTVASGTQLTGALANNDMLDLTTSGTPESNPLVSDGTNVLVAGTDYSLTVDATNKKSTFKVLKASSFEANTMYFVAFPSGSTLA